MSNPWLNVPLADYEGHMDSPGVAQLRALSDLFAQALALCHPESVIILGIAGGNGLEHIDANITKRVVGLDTNPSYLDAARRRFPMLPGLELHCLDLAQPLSVLSTPAQLVHAALVFEHAGVGFCLDNAISLVGPGGALSVVLQLPSDSTEAVSSTPFASMRNLSAHFSFVNPSDLRQTLERCGFPLTHETRTALPAGKAFWMGIFRRQ